MADSAALRNALGLSPDASDDEVRASLFAQFAERDDVLATAVADGKFRSSQMAEFAALWDKDPASTRNLIAQLEPWRAPAVVPPTRDSADPDDEYESLFPPVDPGLDSGGEFAALFPPTGKR